MITIEELYEIYKEYPLVSTDTRQIREGMLFFGLVGDRFDGQAFALDALQNGAAYAVVQDAELAKKDERLLLVPDTLVALQHLARHHRRQLNCPVLALTGSNGKTTTKELIAIVLQSSYSTLATSGNFNNHIGVPLTLLRARLQHELVVVEMGANHQGEIDALCRIAEPSHGLITNIGKAHLEGFGGIEGVKKGKSELYRYLAETDGVAFVNLDEPFLKELSQPVSRRVYYGSKASDSVYSVQLEADSPYLTVTFGAGDHPAQTQLTGSYNFSNIMTAIIIGQYFKIPEDRIADAITSYRPENNRSQWVEKKEYKVLLDAYNANPSSVKVALTAFARRQDPESWVILGDMLELGEDSQAEHQAILDLACQFNFSKVITIGTEFSRARHPQRTAHYSELTELKEWWDRESKKGVVILLKASRGIGLERLLTSAPLSQQ